MNLFDSHSRPLPRFYDLTIERRAEAIMTERNMVAVRRMRMTKRAFFLEAQRLSFCDDSIGLLDIVSTKRARALYQRILLGENHA